MLNIFKKKYFYTKDEIVKLLIDYHEHNSNKIKKLNLKYFMPSRNYQHIFLIQEYDIVKIDEEHNTITFIESNNSNNKIMVELEFIYFSKDDIVVNYSARTILYEAVIEYYQVSVNPPYEENKQNTPEMLKKYPRRVNSFWRLYYNPDEKIYGGSGISRENEPYSREKYERFLKYAYKQHAFESSKEMIIPMYSENRLLIKKYENKDLSIFDSRLLKSFAFDRTCLQTKFNNINISVYATIDEDSIIKRIQKIEKILEEKTYEIWLNKQIKGIHKLYKDWYNEDESPLPFITDINEYEKQYFLTSLTIDKSGKIHASYMDKSDSFAGHGVHITIGSKGKVNKFEI